MSMTIGKNHRILIAGAILGIACATVTAAPRDIQITEININTGVITLHNFGATDEPLDSYRFCSHDDNEVRRYSASGGLNGKTIEAGTDFFVWWSNGGPNDADNTNAKNITGNFAGPIDNGPFGVSLYFPPVSFGNGATMADHAQWSVGGSDNKTADERSDEAELGGLWTDQSLWISTTTTSEVIRLQPKFGGQILHSPDDYATFSPIEGDLNGDYLVDTADLGSLIAVFGTVDLDVDLNGDTIVDTADLGILIANFGSTNP